MTEPSARTTPAPAQSDFSAQSDQTESPHLDEKITRRAVTTIMAVIAALAFVFSFGNVWAPGRALGVPAWIAPLVGPAIDLSVVGLLCAVRALALAGVPSSQLRGARALLVFCGLVTLVLNVAGSVAEAEYGRAAFDGVAPVLLLGWAEVGPRLLRQIHTVHGTRKTGHSAAVGPVGPVGLEAAPRSACAARDPVESDCAEAGHRPGRGADRLLEDALRIDVEHRRAHGRPIAADTLRRHLGISSARARSLVTAVRSSEP